MCLGGCRCACGAGLLLSALLVRRLLLALEVGSHVLLSGVRWRALACAGVQRSARPCARETDVCRWRRMLPPQNDCALQRRLLVPPDPEVATETYLRGLCASDTSSSDSALMVVARRWRGHTSNSNADQPQGCLDTRSSVRQRNPELLQSRQVQRRPRGVDKGASDNVALRLRCF